MEEIKEKVFEGDEDKSPGPDRFNLEIHEKVLRYCGGGDRAFRSRILQRR